MFFYSFQIGHHQGERFVNPEFALAKFVHCLVIGGITCQVKATQAFDGDDFTVWMASS